MLKAFLVSLFTVIVSDIVIAETNKQKEKLFNADLLQIDSLHAVLNISVKDQDTISITMDGPEQLTESVFITMDNDRLNLQQKYTPAIGNVSSTVISQGKGNNHSMVSINGQTIIVKNNDITIVENIMQEKLVVNITVPFGTPVSLNDFKGDANIGDISAAFELTTSGDVKVGRVTKAIIKTDRSADVTISEVTQQLDLDVSDNADVVVESGDIDYLSINVSKNGEAEFNGKALNAEIAATGNGDVIVAHIVNEPRISLAGNADVLIKNRK